ncbi:MAG TPA: hypothetical protein DCY20_02605 [Firmicutes bacterium]|nr:hypothetical protein [Bacillota bacterium]
MSSSVNVKGKMTFFLEDQENGEFGIACIVEDYDEQKLSMVYDLIDGQAFLNGVVAGALNQYEGFIANIFVDGYESNLGISTNNLQQGEFMVSRSAWEKICEISEVLVDWGTKASPKQEIQAIYALQRYR